MSVLQRDLPCLPFATGGVFVHPLFHTHSAGGDLSLSLRAPWKEDPQHIPGFRISQVPRAVPNKPHITHLPACAGLMQPVRLVCKPASIQFEEAKLW